jgi:uncharacterized surface anchored protein
LRRLATLIVGLVCVTMVIAATPARHIALGTGSISGTITDSVTGSPIGGAKVMVNCHTSATTGSDGRYTIANLAAGDYPVTVMKTGYVMKAYPGTVHVAEGQAVTGIDIALAPMGGGGSGSISGTVYDKKTNAPVAGAKVTASGCSRSTTTGSDGTYTITGLADGSYTVRAMKSGYLCATYPTPVVITNGQPVTGIDFHLQSTSHIAQD